MCYNRRALERVAKEPGVPVSPEPSGVFRAQTVPVLDSPNSVAAKPSEFPAADEDASRYCPVCSQRLESRRCKLICPVCGYYMSCADYY
jgi:hypothetical protein